MIHYINYYYYNVNFKRISNCQKLQTEVNFPDEQYRWSSIWNVRIHYINYNSYNINIKWPVIITNCRQMTISPMSNIDDLPYEMLGYIILIIIPTILTLKWPVIITNCRQRTISPKSNLKDLRSSLKRKSGMTEPSTLSATCHSRRRRNLPNVNLPLSFL